jgi:hypothetical protein
MKRERGLSKRSHRAAVIIVASSAALAALLVVLLAYRPLVVWDFSKTHTLADIGVTEASSRVAWINFSYYGPGWWIGEFPKGNLNLLVRLPSGRSFRFGNAGVGLYGHGGAIGAIAIRDGYYSYAGAERKLERWLACWHFPKKSYRRLRKFVSSLSMLTARGQYPEIHLYATRGYHVPSAAASLYVPATAPAGQCCISVTVVWFYTLSATSFLPQDASPIGVGKTAFIGNRSRAKNLVKLEK